MDPGQECGVGEQALTPLTPVELLVLRVGAIVSRAHRQQHDVLARGLLEGQCHRDAATLSGQVGLHAEHCRDEGELGSASTHLRG